MRAVTPAFGPMRSGGPGSEGSSGPIHPPGTVVGGPLGPVHPPGTVVGVRSAPFTPLARWSPSRNLGTRRTHPVRCGGPIREGSPTPETGDPTVHSPAGGEVRLPPCRVAAWGSGLLGHRARRPVWARTPGLLLVDVGAGGVGDGGVLGAAHGWGLVAAAAVGLGPADPVLPPGAGVLGRPGQPDVGVGRALRSEEHMS